LDLQWESRAELPEEVELFDAHTHLGTDIDDVELFGSHVRASRDSKCDSKGERAHDELRVVQGVASAAAGM
jgi:hypothetical protein